MTLILRSRLTEIRQIAAGRALRVLPRLRKVYGAGHWRKMKGKGWVEVPSGEIRLAELHWYEAHGIGRRELKIKRLLDESSRTPP